MTRPEAHADVHGRNFPHQPSNPSIPRASRDGNLFVSRFSSTYLLRLAFVVCIGVFLHYSMQSYLTSLQPPSAIPLVPSALSPLELAVVPAALQPSCPLLALAGFTCTAFVSNLALAGPTMAGSNSISYASFGYMFVTDPNRHVIWKVSHQGEVNQLTGITDTPGMMNGVIVNSTFNGPRSVIWVNNSDPDKSGLYIADTGNNAIRFVHFNGTEFDAVSLIAGGNSLFNASGDVAVGVAPPAAVNGYASAATFQTPRSVARLKSGGMVVADAVNHLIRFIDTNRTVSTYAGTSGVAGADDGIGGTSTFRNPSGVAVDYRDMVYVADTGNNVIRVISSSKYVLTYAGNASRPAGTVNAVADQAAFNTPVAIAVSRFWDGSIVVFVADVAGHVIRYIHNGFVGTLAGSYGNAGNVNGNVVAANGNALVQFSSPAALAVDSVDAFGMLFVLESGGTIRTLEIASSCTTGYFRALTGCQACSSRCSTCSNATAAGCQVCQPGYVLTATGCVCAPGFYTYGNNSCAACAPNCLSCINNQPQACLNCAPNYGFSPTLGCLTCGIDKVLILGTGNCSSPAPCFMNSYLMGSVVITVSPAMGGIAAQFTFSDGRAPTTANFLTSTYMRLANADPSATPIAGSYSPNTCTISWSNTETWKQPTCGCTPTTAPPTVAPTASIPGVNASLIQNTTFRARLNTDGLTITVSFDQSMGLASTYFTSNCAAFSNDTRLYGTRPTCVWMSQSTMQIRCSGDALIQPGDVIVLYRTMYDGVLTYEVSKGFLNVVPRAMGSSFPLIPNATKYGYALAALQSPANVMTPTPVISSPAQIGLCDNVTFDASLSTGSMGRPFQVQWAINMSNPSLTGDAAIISALTTQGFSSANIAELMLRFSTANTQGRVVFTLPGYLFPSNSQFKVSLTLQNWLGKSATRLASFTKGGLPSLPLVLSDISYRSVPRANVFTISASTDYTLKGMCVSLTSSNLNLAFQWRQLTAWPSSITSLSGVDIASMTPIQTTLLNVPTLSASSRQLILPARSMIAGSTYVFRVTFSAQLPLVGSATPVAVSSSSVIALSVTASSLIAKITGGDRTFSVTNPTGILILDAGSGSYDPDFAASSATNDPNLQFSWSCVFLTSRFPCSEFVVNALRTSTFRVATSTLLSWIGTENKLEIKSTVTKGSRTATSSPVIITLSPLALPTLTVSVEGPRRPGPAVINPNDRIALISTAFSPPSGLPISSYTYTWSSAVSFLVLSNADTKLATSINSPTLVFNPNSLIGGLTYELTLTLSNQFNPSLNVAVNVSFAVNSPPQNGLCAVSPLTGLALSTTFEFACPDFTDDMSDQPFSYKYEVLDSGTVAGYLLRPLQSVSTFSSSLPAAFVSSSNSTPTPINIRATICDKWGACTFQLLQAIVNMPDVSNSAVVSNEATKTLSSLKNVQKTGSVIDGAALVSSLTSLLDAASFAKNAAANRRPGAKFSFMDASSTADSSSQLAQQERTEIRSQLLDVVMALGNFTDTSSASAASESLTQQVNMLNQVVSVPSEISPTVQTSAAQFTASKILDAITTTEGSALSPIMSKAALGAVGNIMAASAMSVGANSNTTNSTAAQAAISTQASVTQSASTVIESVSRGQLIGAFPGETSVLKTDSITIASSRISLNDIASGSSNGFGSSGPASVASLTPVNATNTTKVSASVILPSTVFSMANVSKVTTVDTSMTILTENVYAFAPTNGTPISPIVSFTIYDASVNPGQSSSAAGEILIKNMTGEINITIPITPSGDLSQEKIANCKFWDEGQKGWSSKGCRVAAVHPTYIVCACTHLTSFQAEELIPPVRSVNDQDIKNAFNLANIGLHPTTISVISALVGLEFLLTLVVFFTRHKRMLSRHLMRRRLIEAAEAEKEERIKQQMWGSNVNLNGFEEIEHLIEAERIEQEERLKLHQKWTNNSVTKTADGKVFVDVVKDTNSDDAKKALLNKVLRQRRRLKFDATLCNMLKEEEKPVEEILDRQQIEVEKAAEELAQKQAAFAGIQLNFANLPKLLNGPMSSSAAAAQLMAQSTSSSNLPKTIAETMLQSAEQVQNPLFALPTLHAPGQIIDENSDDSGFGLEKKLHAPQSVEIEMAPKSKLYTPDAMNASNSASAPSSSQNVIKSLKDLFAPSTLSILNRYRDDIDAAALDTPTSNAKSAYADVEADDEDEEEPGDQSEAVAQIVDSRSDTVSSVETSDEIQHIPKRKKKSSQSLESNKQSVQTGNVGWSVMGNVSTSLLCGLINPEATSAFIVPSTVDTQTVFSVQLIDTAKAELLEAQKTGDNFLWLKSERTWEVVKENILNNLMGRHALFSILWHHPLDNYGTYQRLLVLFCMVYTFLAVNAAFYGQSGKSILSDFSIAITSSLIALPVGMLLPRMYHKAEEWRKIELSQRLADPESVRSCCPASRLMLFWAHLFCFIFKAGAIFMTLVYGMQFDLTMVRVGDWSVSGRWLWSCMISIMLNFFVKGPVIAIIVITLQTLRARRRIDVELREAAERRLAKLKAASEARQDDGESDSDNSHRDSHIDEDENAAAAYRETSSQELARELNDSVNNQFMFGSGNAGMMAAYMQSGNPI